MTFQLGAVMIEIRNATIDDATAISKLVIDCAKQHIAPTLTATGLQNLVSEMSSANQLERISLGYKSFVATFENAVVGTVAVKLPSHRYYLFVKTDRQGQGIGRKLFRSARAYITKSDDFTSITVNSSLNAVAVYQSLGFVVSGPVECKNEVSYQPMQITSW